MNGRCSKEVVNVVNRAQPMEEGDREIGPIGELRTQPWEPLHIEEGQWYERNAENQGNLQHRNPIKLRSRPPAFRPRPTTIGWDEGEGWEEEGDEVLLRRNTVPAGPIFCFQHFQYY